MRNHQSLISNLQSLISSLQSLNSSLQSLVSSLESLVSQHLHRTACAAVKALQPPLGVSLNLLTSLLLLTGCGLLPRGGVTPSPGITAPAATATRAQQSSGPTRGASTPNAAAEVESAARLQRIADVLVTDPTRLVWSPDGKSLGAVTQTGFSLINAQTFQATRMVAINQPTVLLDLSPDLRVFAQTTDQQSIELRDTSNNSLLRTIKLGSFGDVVFAPDGRTFAVTSMDEIAATLWDAQTGQQTKKLAGFQTAAPVYQVDFSADGKTMLWVSRGSIQVMDIATGKLGMRFDHEDFVFDQALTPDGRTLITAAEGTIIFWDVASGKKSRASPPVNPVAIALSPGGRVLAVASGNNVLLWDVANQKQLRMLTGHADRVTSVAFAPEGLTLASASDDDVVKVWGVK
jgi:WD40 repeat protein